DVELQSKAITEEGLAPRYFLLCTDDSHSATLVEDGHMDRVIRHAIDQGLPPMTAIQMATINTAEHFGLSRKMGLLAPGRSADVLIVPDLNNFHAEKVIAQGKLVAENGSLLLSKEKRIYPDWAKNTIRLPKPKVAADFMLNSAIVKKGVVTANVIGVLENQAPNKHLTMTVNVVDGKVASDLEQDIAKIALVERHHNTGKVFVALIHGMKLKPDCALGSTVAHDCHQMIIVGTSDEMMAKAANELAAMGGGQIAVKDGAVVGKVTLPVAGLMSDQPAEVVAAEAATVLDGFKACGCDLNNANMQLSLMALVVIPELRISDMGLLSVLDREFIPVIQWETNA
ncbi:MAG TPA: adenine deaminase C-terminal domain-containing protein, partial [Bellilinea sp.]|nr:adenine deaminase C-terminal domain-containing protein [Bellilinea sp.]